MRQTKIFEEFQTYEGALTFDDWSQFIQACNAIQQPMPVEQACELVGLNPKYFAKVVDESFDNWRESTTTSILHGISYIRLGQVPEQGKAVFIDLEWQTRFFLKCRKLSSVFLLDTKKIFKGGKPVLVKGTPALAATEQVISPANRVLRCLYLYWWMNSRMKVKLPKRIYRGIRAHDLYNHDTLKPAIEAIFKADKSRAMMRKDAIDILIRWICDKKLHQIADGNILSFTASIPVAKYFSNATGFVLAVDPSKVDIISSELHDERMQGKDYMSGKNEREYIVRIPKDYPFKPEDIIINDLDYFIADQNPLSLGMFDHDDKEAHYTINNVPVVAWFSWRNENSGGLLFQSPPNKWPINRREYVKAFGFDPLPTEKNLSQISNFTIKPHKKYGY